MLLGEFLAPEAANPVFWEGLASLGLVAAFFVAFGMTKMVDAIIRGTLGVMASAIGHLPIVGGVGGSLIHRAERVLTHYLGDAERFFDHHMGSCWHRAAKTFEHIGRELWATPHLLREAVTAMESFLSRKHFHRLLHAALAPLRAAEHALGRLERQAEARIRALVHSVAQGVFPRLKTLEHDVGRVIPKEIQRTRSLAHEAEAEALRAWKLAKKHEGLFGATAFAGLVAFALSRLGLGFLRCSNVRRVGREICGLNPQTLDALLASLLAAFTIAELRTLTREAAEIEHAVTEGIRDILNA